MNNTHEHRFWSFLRATFSRGVAVIVPVVITIWVLNLLFNAVDGIISPVFDRVLGKQIPGLGFVSMIVLIFIVGLLSRNLIGRTLFRWFERLLASIPLARTIYTAMKDVINAFEPGKKGRSFREVVLIDYPRLGLSTIGFVTNEISIGERLPNTMISVYIPNPPNPTSGLMLLVPRESVRTLDLSVEEGLKLVLSGGIVTSGQLSLKEEVHIGKEQS